jgi:type VI secretion system protein ImpA
MSAVWEAEELLQPIRGDDPCGESLEDTLLLGTFDAYQLFGQSTLEPEPIEPGQPIPKNPPKNRPPDWVEIKTRALEALEKSKDLRLLAHLGTAMLRTDGLPAFAKTITVASDWLDRYWNESFPPVDSDGVLRQSALNCFCDPVAVLDGLRRAPLVNDRRLGRYSLRDVEIASGLLNPANGEPRVDASQIDAAFAAMPLDELTALCGGVTEASEALRRIDQKMRDEVGNEAAPSFDGLSVQLQKVDRVLREQLKRHPDNVEAAADETSDAPAAQNGTPAAPGVITSRAEAVRALDAVSAFFQQTEPSSPVPLLLARAKRLVSKSFLEVLADLAPGALEQARAASGVKDEDVER